MRELSIREMRAKLGGLDRLVQSEGEILITRRGVPIARLLPVKEAQRRPTSHAKLRSAAQRFKTPSEALIRDDRDQR